MEVSQYIPSMKTVLMVLMFVLIVLACGCTTTSTSSAAPASIPAPAATVASIPNMIGNWTGTANAYTEGIGYSNYNNGTMMMVVTRQQDRIFSGAFIFTSNGTTSSVPFAAAIDSNGKTFQDVEKDNGYSTGQIVSANEIEMIYTNSVTPYEVAIDTLTRV
jgi:hypothetical protein